MNKCYLFARLPFGGPTASSTTHAELATTVSANIHAYISNPTHQQSTNRHFSFVFMTIRCAAIAPSRTDSFFFFNNHQDNPFRTTNPIQRSRYNPTLRTLHMHSHISRIHRSINPHYAVRPHLTEVSNVKI